MQNWLLLLIFESIPIILWGLGWYFDKNFSEYPDTKKGFKTRESKSNKEIWIYGNKIAAKIFEGTGTLLFFVIAIGIAVLGANPVVMAFIIFIVICICYIIIDGIIKKKYKNQK